MAKMLSILLVLGLLMLPMAAAADIDITMDYCESSQDLDYLILHFSMVNFSLPTAVCDMHFTYEPLPPPAGCEFLNVAAPSGWSSFLNPVGADWFANTPADCVSPGDPPKYGFEIWVDKNLFDWCCFVVQFTDATGAVIFEDEVCFSCTIIPTEEGTWSTIKELYR